MGIYHVSINTKISLSLAIKNYLVYIKIIDISVVTVYDNNKIYFNINLARKREEKLVCNIPENIYVVYKDDGSWVNTRIISMWISLVITKHAKKLPIGKRLIFTDNHRSHTCQDTIKKLDELGFDVLFLTPNQTGELQPMEIFVNKVIKERYSAAWQEWYEKHSSCKFTEKGKILFPHKRIFILWVSEILSEIAREKAIIESGFNIYDLQLLCKLMYHNILIKAFRGVFKEEAKEKHDFSPEVEDNSTGDENN